MRPLVLLAATAIAAWGAGCGDDDSGDFEGTEAEVAAVVDELEAAVKEADGKRICEQLFTRNLRISVTKASKQPCPAEVVENTFTEDASYDIEDLALKEGVATVRVKDQEDRESVLLIYKERGSWRIGRIS